jgi:hypothetical protein
VAASAAAGEYAAEIGMLPTGPILAGSTSEEAMMFRPADLATFSLAEFERGLVGLTDEEARVRQAKADGTRMNGISWIVAHVASQWLAAQSRSVSEGPAETRRRYGFRSEDPTPPSLAEARELLALAKQGLGWIEAADDVVMARVGAPGATVTAAESVGTFMLRTVLHTWLHTGEINAIRQMLGHAEIPFVGTMVDHLEWRPSSDRSGT